MNDLWISLIHKVKTLLNLNNNQFVKTTKGKVGRLESRNKSLNNITISFGSFADNGQWIIKNKITISDNNILCTLTKEQCARELTSLLTNTNNKRNK